MAKGKYRTLAARFQSFSIQKGTESLGVQIDRYKLSLDDADAMFTNAQIEAELKCDPSAAKDVEGQDTFKDMSVSLDIIGDVKGFRVDREKFTLSIQVNKDECEPNDLGQFAFTRGFIKCRRVGDRQGKDENEADGDEAQEAA